MIDFSYSFEEFSSNLKAMEQVQNWEYTTIFGHLGNRDPASANMARVIEYFSDTYLNRKEAGQKEFCFSEIHEYIFEHKDFFFRRGLMTKKQDGFVSINSSLFRAVHYLFTSKAIQFTPRNVSARQIAKLAKDFERLDLGCIPVLKKILHSIISKKPSD